jgi:flagellar export protein FliJ
MSFSFRLQRVLELREKAEQARARTLRDANENADLLREQANALHSLRTLQRESLDAASRGLISAGELQHVAYLIDQLDTRLAKASDDAAEAQRVALEAQQALQLASRDRRVLGRLKACRTLVGDGAAARSLGYGRDRAVPLHSQAPDR